MNIRRSLVTCAILSVALASCMAFAQKPGAPKNKAPEGVAAQAADMSPGAMQPVDLSGSARGCSEASSFLSQPQLSEAIAKARADKQAGKEAARNPSAYLAKNGVNVPSDIRVRMNPSSGGGPAEAVKVTITVRCCPLEIIITIQF